ncbi:nucleoside hydrolase [Coraliomargarita parva]|uniref:nucleoside hydrolase n=1 Tax=Coraliomargarita parva TaxID=3014050 RepID=UPI0022B55EDC|nr:nucleoside hydrolase [Coraliomargarita parva]
MQKIIIDSDWGSDVLQLTSILLARPGQYEVIGATVTFGNASHDQNLANAGALLRLLGVDGKVPRFAGARAPSGQMAPPEGDGAHGSTGLGEIILPPAQSEPDSRPVVDFLIETLEKEPEGSVTLIATAPQTNLAEAIRRSPQVMQRLKEIRIMGGCTQPMPGYRVDKHLNRVSEIQIQRCGNITEWAEFNFQQAPEDAATVLKSGIPVSLFPMNCTHQMTFTPEREALLHSTFADEPELAAKLVPLLSIPRVIDRQKFDIDPTLHDVHTTLAMVAPELYQARQGKVTIATDSALDNYGETSFYPDPAGVHTVYESILDPDAAFVLLLEALKQTLNRNEALACAS